VHVEIHVTRGRYEGIETSSSDVSVLGRKVPVVVLLDPSCKINL
jgi:hypothetical protein